MTNELEDQIVARTESYIRDEQMPRAQESADELADIDPKDAIVWYLKGKVHYLNGQYDEALAALSQAATIDQARPDIWLVMSYALIAMRRYADALPGLDYVKGLQPDNVEALSALGVAHTILGDAEAAAENFALAFKANPDGASAVVERFIADFFDPSPAIPPATRSALQDAASRKRLRD